MDDPTNRAEQFILKYIDTVPHLEALLLLWTGRDRTWSTADIRARLFVSVDRAREIARHLVKNDLAVAVSDDVYRYNPGAERDLQVAEVQTVYAHDLIRISQFIHSRPSSAIRAFADAFRMKKDGN